METNKFPTLQQPHEGSHSRSVVQPQRESRGGLGSFHALSADELEFHAQRLESNTRPVRSLVEIACRATSLS